MLKGKKILIGITGGIAAYKIPFLVRLLVKDGAEVKVVMTESARQFVTPETLSVLSKNPVQLDFFDNNHNWNNHVALGEWADLLVLAPLTANTLAKMAAGLCDNLLLACYLSARSKTVVAPAMDLDMYQHPTVKKNLETISQYGNKIIPPGTGELASGLNGEGRMAEPEEIRDYIISHFGIDLPFKGKKVLVNAGPTYEAIDPVRFIGNRSSGKMGVAIAEAFVNAGATVTLVLGPSQLTPSSKIVLHRVESSAEMHAEMMSRFDSADVVVCSAAVADYKPKTVAVQKIKKNDAAMQLDLISTNDILAELGKKKTRQFLVGFALETENLEKNARLKLEKKNLDLIVANSATEAGSGFGVDTNKLLVIGKDNKITKFELLNKAEAATRLVQLIASKLSGK